VDVLAVTLFFVSMLALFSAIQKSKGREWPTSSQVPCLLVVNYASSSKQVRGEAWRQVRNKFNKCEEQEGFSAVVPRASVVRFV
jgi:hypothetical protein